MTNAVRTSRILKDANGDFSDHLRNHVHLTNCIHLKNHMHKQKSPMPGDRSLMRDLTVLQRSRSLRDPSASPPSWHSPSVVDLLPKKGYEGDHIQEGRRSVGIDRRRESSRRLSGTSPRFSSHLMSKVVPDDVTGHDVRRVKREESSGRKSGRADDDGDDDPFRNQDVNVGLFLDTISGNSGSKDRRSRQKSKLSEGVHIKTLSQQLNEVAMDSEDVASCNVHHNGSRSGGNRGKRRKFKGARRSRATASRGDIAAQKEQAQSSSRPRRAHLDEEGGEEYGDQNVTRAPRNGCGIPWNWSRIHDKGKTILDKAGRSLSCGLSESRLRRGSNDDGNGDMPMVSGQSSSSSRSDAEALPLLVEPYGSQETSDNAGWVHDYSGELGLYADNLLRNDLDSDLASEARSGGQRNQTRSLNRSRHQNLTQKYMPRSFRDLVGQNLVSQALANAVMKRKIGLLYVFYGPHGTGKTSCARIFARALNCQSTEGPMPCGSCKSCTAHSMGKNRNIKEVGPVSNFDFESIINLLDNMTVSQLPSKYKVFIFDDCDTLSPDLWSAMSKVVDRAPRRVVFILVSSSLDVLPHIVVSRCQKFFFPKLKDADIIYTLQWIASREDIDIDKDALKLIASRSDGSLRDAEMTLEQLSLLGQKISVPLVQELVGLISDEKLVDLLDLALSADTVNTVKNLRVIMETGVEPLALMSQLATVITDILAGTYDFTRERHRRKFFRRQPMSKEEMEKLRQALKTLSEAEKQLRMSNDKLTWLTAALLQLAPDQQYLLPSSSTEPSFSHSPLTARQDMTRTVAQHDREDIPIGTSVDLHGTRMMDRKRNLSVSETAVAPQRSSGRPSNAGKTTEMQISGKTRMGYGEIWHEVIEKIRIKSIRDFLYQEGTLVSVSFGAAPTVHLLFSSQLTKSKAEKFTTYLLQAFESVLGSPVTIEIRTAPASKSHTPLVLPAFSPQPKPAESLDAGRDEIVELPASPREHGGELQHEAIPRKLTQSKSLVRSKVSLAHVIQQGEGCTTTTTSTTQPSRRSNRKAVSIAEKLEQENLRLEPRSRSMLCWKSSRVTRRKLSRLKIRGRKPESLLKLISCGKCLSAKPKSPTLEI
ncbi:Protein STICHEL-like 3 [Linum perenne]